MKTKGTDIGKVGGNHPAGAPIGDTSRSRVGGTIPATAPLPTMADQMPYLTATPSVNMPVTQNTDSLGILSPSAGYTDTGASSTGDLGGAA